MASNSSYPSPGAQEMPSSSGPFYTGELDLAAKLSRAAAPLMVTTGADDMQAHHSLVSAPHVLSPSRNVGSPQQLAQDVMSLQTEAYNTTQSRHHDILIPESNHVKKRTKVSRACDECRRKKTRCNATPESTEPCAGCRRSNAQCMFSRQPLKRGPSKGYIRHLSERLASLERTLGSHSTAMSPPALAPISQQQNLMGEYPTSQILYDRMERLEGRIEEMLSQIGSGPSASSLMASSAGSVMDSITGVENGDLGPVTGVSSDMPVTGLDGVDGDDTKVAALQSI